MVFMRGRISARSTVLAVMLALFLVISAVPVGDTAASPRGEVFLVGFDQMPGNSAMGLLRARGDIIHTFEIIPVVAIRLPAASVLQAKGLLQGIPGLRYVEPNGTVQALGQIVPWGVERVGAPDAWERSTGITGTGVKVAILDTGIADHEDLNVLGGTNTIDGGNSYNDGHGHGTHVAGTVAALNNEIGVVGVAYDAHLYAVKVLDDGGGGTWLSVSQGIEWAVTNNMDVINMSLGGSQHSDTLEDACQFAYDEGLVVVAAAGNSGNPPGNGDNVGYPARFDTVIAVAASDQNDNRARWSSTGPDVELIAPGVGVLSTVPEDEYASYSGTSMASPHVAGVAALVLAANSSLSNSDVRTILQSTAQDLGMSQSRQGHGLVRADLAVAEALALVEEYDPEVARVTVEGAGSITIPAEGDVTEEYTATVYDQNGAVMADEVVVWSLAKEVDGVSVDEETGLVTVEPNAVEGTTFTVVATSETKNTVSGMLEVDLVAPLAEPVVTSIAVEGAELITIPADEPVTEEYTATVYDQNGAVMADEVVIWSLAEEVTGVSVDENTGVVTVGPDAEEGTFTVIATSVTDDSKSGQLSVDLVEQPLLKELQASVTTDRDDYAIGDTVVMTVKVTDSESVAVQGASVDLTVRTASGRVYTGSASTNSEGIVAFSLKTKRPDGFGTYRVYVTANKTGYLEATAETSFVVE